MTFVVDVVIDLPLVFLCFLLLSNAIFCLNDTREMVPEGMSLRFFFPFYFHLIFKFSFTTPKKGSLYSNGK